MEYSIVLISVGQLAVQSFRLIPYIFNPVGLCTDAQRSAVSVELQKRMEDSSDAVRIGILPAIAAFFETMPASSSDEVVSARLSGL